MSMVRTPTVLWSVFLGVKLELVGESSEEREDLSPIETLCAKKRYGRRGHMDYGAARARARTHAHTHILFNE